MNAFEQLKLDVYESTLDDDDKMRYLNLMESCDEEDVQDICESVEMILDGEEYVTEASLSPARSVKKDLEKIKNSKPDDYSGDNEIINYVDKNYDKLVNCAEILEKEPAKLRSNEIKMCVGFVLGLIGSASLMVLGGGVGIAVGLTGWVLSYISPFIYAIIAYARGCDDRKAMDDLTKIKKSLMKVKDKKGLPETQKKKIAKIIDKIDDAETECNARFKTEK